MMTPTTIGPFFVRLDQYEVLRNSKNAICGIYRIINCANGKSYVGSTANLAQRLIAHASLLKLGRHSNSYLQGSFNKHGAGMFAFFIEEICKKESLLAAENEVIKRYKSVDRDNGYNLQMGVRDDTIGRWTDEIKIKISESNKKTYSQRPESCLKNSIRLTEWHKKNPGVSGGPRKIYNYVHKSGLTFTGCANELRRAFPCDGLKQSHLWELSSGKAKSHKGWTIIK